MRWKAKPKEYDTEWHKFFPILPVKTQDGYYVMFEYVSRRWKIHMSGGKYVYQFIKP